MKLTTIDDNVLDIDGDGDEENALQVMTAADVARTATSVRLKKNAIFFVFRTCFYLYKRCNNMLL